MTVTRNTTGTYTATQRARCGVLVVSEHEDRLRAMVECYEMVALRDLRALS